MSSNTRINPSKDNPRRRSNRIVPKLTEMHPVKLRKHYIEAFGAYPVLINANTNTNLRNKPPRSKKNSRRKSNTYLVMKSYNRSSEATPPNFVVKKSKFIKQANKSKRTRSLEPLPNINSARNKLIANIKSRGLFSKTASKMPIQKSLKVLRKDMIPKLKSARKLAMGTAQATHPLDRLNPKTIQDYSETMNYYYERIEQKLIKQINNLR